MKISQHDVSVGSVVSIYALPVVSTPMNTITVKHVQRISNQIRMLQIITLPMREIKFRVWDKINKKMYPVVWFDERVVSYKIPKEGNEPWERAQVMLIDCELLEYTGHKDKNGLEIYEGDIMTGYDKDDPYIVEFREGTFIICSPNDGGSRVCTHYLYMKGLTVIGNIHKDPELLIKK